MADNYNAATARDAYYPADSNQIARVHAREKTLHDMADFGMAEFFEGTGDNPTGLTGYSTEKLWLRQSGSGVTTTPGTIRFYNGGDATLLANWPTMTKSGAMLHMGVRGADLDFVWSASTAGDPGSGKILVNHATLASATTISISKTGRVGQSYASTLSGIIANGARFLIYQLGTQTAYLNITTTGSIWERTHAAEAFQLTLQPADPETGFPAGMRSPSGVVYADGEHFSSPSNVWA